MKSNSREEVQNRIETYMKEVSRTAKKLKLSVRLIINFKNPKQKAPLLGKIAIFLLKRSGGFIDSQFINLKK